MDFSKFDVSKKADAGREFNDFVWEDGTPLPDLKVTLYSSTSSRANKKLAEIRNSTKVSDLKNMTLGHVHKQTLERNIACTGSWNMVLDGRDYPATPENVRAIYENPGYDWFYKQISDRIEDTENFLSSADNS